MRQGSQHASRSKISGPPRPLAAERPADAGERTPTDPAVPRSRRMRRRLGLIAGGLIVTAAGILVAHLAWQRWNASRPQRAPGPAAQVPAPPAQDSRGGFASARRPLEWRVANVRVSLEQREGRTAHLATATLEFSDPRAARELTEDDWEVTAGAIVREFHTEITRGRFLGFLVLELPDGNGQEAQPVSLRLKGRDEWRTLPIRRGTATRSEGAAPARAAPQAPEPAPPPASPPTPPPPTPLPCEVTSFVLWKGTRTGVSGRWVVAKVEFRGTLAEIAPQLTASDWESTEGWEVKEFSAPAAGRPAVGILWILRPEDPMATLSTLRLRLRGTEEWLALPTRKRERPGESENYAPQRSLPENMSPLPTP